MSQVNRSRSWVVPCVVLGVFGVALVDPTCWAAAPQSGAPHPSAVTPDGVWTRIAAIPPDVLAMRAWIRPTAGQPLQLDRARLDRILAAAPREGAESVGRSRAVITLPRPDGTLKRFAFVESPILAPELQAKFPRLRAYLAQGLDHPAATARFDISPLGFRAQVLEPADPANGSTGAWYIDPVSGGETRHYMSYQLGSLPGSPDRRCDTPQAEAIEDPAAIRSATSGASRGAEDAPLEVVRHEFGIAVAATGEFSVAVGNRMNPPRAPDVELIHGVIQTTINRVTHILENDGPVRLLVIAGNDQLIYLNPATDPYDPTKPQAALQQDFQNTINAVIGTTNYSFGHTFHWQSAGFLGDAGGIGVVCNDSKKALAFSSSSSSFGDFFDVDLVAHEIGHQLGATHTFNGVFGSCGSVGGSSQWTAGSAYEPGSGSTIMSYAGNCGSDDVRTRPPASPPPDPPTANGASLPMYNLSSMIQIANHVTGVTCATRVPTGNFHPGAVPATQGPYVIPSDTPFRLIAPSAEFGGPNDSLSYSIEQFDLGPQRALGQDTGAGEPLFRVLPPSPFPERSFPVFSAVLSGTPVKGENLPRYARNSAFRGVLRDNVAGAGGWSWGDIAVQVVEVPLPGFRVTAPTTGGGYCAGGALGVTWNVANTNLPPIDASTVDILMSSDGGQSFPITLAADFPNAGAALLPVPAVPTTAARVMVQSSGGLFFHVNNGPFEVANATPTIAVQPVGAAVCRGQTVTLSFTPGPGSPRHIQWYKDDVPIAGATGQSHVIDIAWTEDTGDYKVVISNACGSVTSNTVRVQVGVSFDQPLTSPNPTACQDVTLQSRARGVGALSYQWRRDGLPIPVGEPRITGQTAANLSIGKVRYEDEAEYYCVVTDQCETRETDRAQLTLPTPNWVQRTISGPIRRGATADLTYDASRGVSVLYGGVHPDGQPLAETWEWDGLEWSARTPPHTPGARHGSELTYDPLHQRVLLFGGYGTAPHPFNNAEVWSYNGADWTLLTSSPTGPPPTVATHGDVAFDAARGKLVLVTAGSGGPWPVNETWEFDPSTTSWQLASTGPGPEYFNSPIAFDDKRDVTVGQVHWWANNPADARSYTFSGFGWSLTPGNPPGRYFPSLAYDATRGRVTLYSCCRGQGPGAYTTDTHAFNGTNWVSVLPDITTSQLDSVIPTGMTFDSRRRAMVMVGSAYNDPYYSPIQTWEFRYRDRVSFDRQPRDASALPGASAQFTTVADGFPGFTYRWRRGGVPLSDGPAPGGSTISGSTTPTLTISSVSASDVAMYSVAVTNQCGEQVSSAAALDIGSAAAGRVPGDRGSTGAPLRVSRSGGSVTLTWDPSCRPSDGDYAVYEGAIGSFAGRLPRHCSTGGLRSATFAPNAGNRYFLVVPRSAVREGSYGVDSAGQERPASTSACLPQTVASCP